MNAVKSILRNASAWDERGQQKDPAHVTYLVGEILATCRDDQSQMFYTRVAQTLPDEAIFQFLSEVRQDPSIRNRGAVFTVKVKGYLQRRRKGSLVGQTGG